MAKSVDRTHDSTPRTSRSNGAPTGKALPLSILYTEKFHLLDDGVWRKREPDRSRALFGRAPGAVEVLNAEAASRFNGAGGLADNVTLQEGQTMPKEFIAVVRPKGVVAKKRGRTDQQSIVPDEMEMHLEVKLFEFAGKTKVVYSAKTTATTKQDVQGLYCFGTAGNALEHLCAQIGTYMFHFSLVTKKFGEVPPAVVRVNVAPSHSHHCNAHCLEKPGDRRRRRRKHTSLSDTTSMETYHYMECLTICHALLQPQQPQCIWRELTFRALWMRLKERLAHRQASHAVGEWQLKPLIMEITRLGSTSGSVGGSVDIAPVVAEDQEAEEEEMPDEPKIDITHVHVTTLDEVVSVNGFFAIAVFLGLAFSPPLPQNQAATTLAPPRLECYVEVNVYRAVVLWEVVSFGCFLFSTLVAHGFKLFIVLENGRDKENSKFAEVNRNFLRFGILASGVGSILGAIFLIVSMVVLIEIRLGDLMCGNPWAVKTTVPFVVLGVSGCAIFIVAVFYESFIY